MTEERLTQKTEEMDPERENMGEEDTPWGWTGFKGKTLWDWLALLIVPAMLVGLGLGFGVFETKQARLAAETANIATGTRAAVQTAAAQGTNQAEKKATTSAAQTAAEATRNRQAEQIKTAEGAATIQAEVEEARIAAQSTIEANRINEDILEATLFK